jgi:hypothetical protein
MPEGNTRTHRRRCSTWSLLLLVRGEDDDGLQTGVATHASCVIELGGVHGVFELVFVHYSRKTAYSPG